MSGVTENLITWDEALKIYGHGLAFQVTLEQGKSQFRDIAENREELDPIDDYFIRDTVVIAHRFEDGSVAHGALTVKFKVHKDKLLKLDAGSKLHATILRDDPYPMIVVV